MNRETVLKKIEHLGNRSNKININGIDVVELMHHAYQLLSMCKGCNNDRQQPAPNKYSYLSMADELKQYIKDNPDEAKKVWDELYTQPALKSAEEVLNELFYKPELHGYYDAIIKAMQLYASQFARYVTDEEIDAMWPIRGDYSLTMKQRQAAKAMRDKIFNNVKPKV